MRVVRKEVSRIQCDLECFYQFRRIDPKVHGAMAEVAVK